jgi:hypothetical protein
MEKEMGSSYQRLLAVAALIFAMSAIVALVVLSPLVWRAGSNPGPAAEAVPAEDEVAQVVAASRSAPRARGQDQPAAPRPAAPQRAAFAASPLSSPQAKQAQPSVVSEKKGEGEVDREGEEEGEREEESEREDEGEGEREEESEREDEGEREGKTEGHEKKALGSEKSGKHGHHAQGAAGKGHGKGKGKDRDRAPARARS